MNTALIIKVSEKRRWYQDKLQKMQIEMLEGKLQSESDNWEELLRREREEIEVLEKRLDAKKETKEKSKKEAEEKAHLEYENEKLKKMLSDYDQSIDGEEECTNYNTACTDWAARGECEKNADYMRKACRKSCGICGVLDPLL